MEIKLYEKYREKRDLQHSFSFVWIPNKIATMFISVFVDLSIKLTI